MPAAALLFRQGHVSPAKKTYCLMPDAGDALRPGPEPRHLGDDPDPRRAEQADDRDARGPRAALAQAVAAVERRDRRHRPRSRLHPAGPVVRPLRHRRADARLGAGNPDDRHAAGPRPSAAGSAARRSRRRDASFETRTKKAVIALTSVDNRPLAESRFILVTAVARGRAQPRRSPAVTSPSRSRRRITLRTKNPDLELLAMGRDGRVVSTPESRAPGGRADVRRPVRRGNPLVCPQDALAAPPKGRPAGAGGESTSKARAMSHDLSAFDGWRMHGRCSAASTTCPIKIPSPVILDIGANIGAFALWAIGRWPGCRLHCYEPLPANFDMLRQNLAHLEGRPRWRSTRSRSAIPAGRGSSWARTIAARRASSTWASNRASRWRWSRGRRTSCPGRTSSRSMPRDPRSRSSRGWGASIRTSCCWNTTPRTDGAGSMLSWPAYVLAGGQVRGPHRGVMKYVHRRFFTGSDPSGDPSASPIVPAPD